MKDRQSDKTPVTVSKATKRTGEAPVSMRWLWTEPKVWTESMLTALENGVRGGKWYHFRWPNAFFAERGLFSLSTAHAQASQSAMR